jgi:hypothetical protein
MLKAVELPARVANLAAGLANVDRNALPLKKRSQNYKNALPLKNCLELEKAHMDRNAHPLQKSAKNYKNALPLKKVLRIIKCTPSEKLFR